MSYVTDRFDREVVRLLKNGAVGFMPSDTIYGLSCWALDEKAVERIYKLKRRDQNKPFVVLISKTDQLAEVGVSTFEITKALKYWPGKLTIICPAEKDSPKWLHRGTNSLAIRQPAKPPLLELLKKTGPLVSTSANLQGDEPIGSVKQAQKVFGDKLDFYINAGRLRSRASTIVKFNFDNTIEVIRQGAVRIRQKGK